MKNDKTAKLMKELISKPLTKRHKEFKNVAQNSALKILDNFAHSQVILNEINELIYPNKQPSQKLSFSESNDIQKKLYHAKALYLANRFCKEEYIFFCIAIIELFHDSRWTNSYYDSQLNPINEQIEEIRTKHGLTPDQYWPRGKGPQEYQKLSKEYDNLFNQTIIETLIEFELDELAEIKEKNPKKFEQLREQGRRIFHHKDALPEAIKETIIHYERDAVKASKAGAYLSGIIALGSALEGILTLVCIQFIDQAQKIFLKLNIKSKSMKFNDPTTWNFDTLIKICTQSGWIQNIETENTIFNASELANYLKKMRNYVHPARQGKERAWMTTDQKEYELSKSFYVAILHSLNKIYNILD